MPRLCLLPSFSLFFFLSLDLPPPPSPFLLPSSPPPSLSPFSSFAAMPAFADEEAELQEAIRLSLCELEHSVSDGLPHAELATSAQAAGAREERLALDEDAELQRAIQDSLLSASSQPLASRPPLPPLSRREACDLTWLGEHSPTSAHAESALPLCASLAPEDDVSELLLPRSRLSQKNARDRCRPPARWQLEEEAELASFSRTLAEALQAPSASRSPDGCLHCGAAWGALEDPNAREGDSSHQGAAQACATSPASEASTDNGGEETGEGQSRGGREGGESRSAASVARASLCRACERACVGGAVLRSVPAEKGEPASSALREEFFSSLAPLDRQLVRRLVGRVFGLGASRSIGVEDIVRWFNHPFLFASEAPSSRLPDDCRDSSGFSSSCCPWGLVQFHGGPCGLLASVQCFLLRALFFSPSRAKRYTSILQSYSSSSPSSSSSSSSSSPSSSSSSSASRCRNGELRLNAECVSLAPLTRTQGHALVEALAAILFQTTEKSRYFVAVADLDVAALAGQARNVEIIHDASADDDLLVYALNVAVKEFDDVQEVMRFYWRFYKLLLQTPAALVSFLFSVVLTRGVDKVRADADAPDHPLLGLYGHCNQELVNLLLQGAGTSNVWDGDKCLGADRDSGAETVLGGIRKRPLVGFLTEMEALRYCEVGDRYKHPHYPLWVLGSGNHYTTLFCRDLLAAALGASRQAEMEAQAAFKAIDQENNTYIFAQQLRPLLDLLGQAHLEAEARGTMGAADGVVLWSEFLAWYTRLIVGMKAARGEMDIEAPRRFAVYMYDGQRPPGPSVRRYLVELQDADFRHAQADACEVARLLWTRWPAAVVTELPLLPLVE
ncbi:hypothetical protein TGARI_286800 [Toxoplasma gondii ARI]|uniref:ubiquitinyl hydrolase 1 n=1 Tax=Toxoplasma gondii ARI TaxID=1074872 RepID=A0A139XY85_TOXGO|nr:hypothetical protein TGARI_286800 [Toxoplasma gondii ARI]